MKDLTGQDQVIARPLYRHSLTFAPTHKLVIIGNHRPITHDSGLAFWRRVLVVPFAVVIPESERVPQSVLLARFAAERSGILLWAINGLRAYRKIGLAPPAAVRAAVTEYRSSQDVVSRFVEQRCTRDSSAVTPLQAIRKDYVSWAMREGERVIGPKILAEGLREMGFGLRRITSGVVVDGLKGGM